MIENIFQKELTLTKQMHQKSVIFVIIGIFLDKEFKYETYLVAVSCCNDVAIVSIKQSDCTIHLWYMSNDDTINIRKNSNLNGKHGLLQIFYYIQERVIKLLITENRE